MFEIEQRELVSNSRLIFEQADSSQEKQLLRSILSEMDTEELEPTADFVALRAEIAEHLSDFVAAQALWQMRAED